MSCAILLNGKAGALHSTAGVEEMKKLVEQLGISAEVIGTESEAQMKSELQRIRNDGVEKVAIAGGDGTVRLAAQELAGSDTCLAIIPQGTANNFASALHLPLELPAALKILEEGRVQEVDLGYIGGRYFTESAGVGLFANALAMYGKPDKNFARAFWTILKIFFSLKASRIKLNIDGEDIVERAVLCTVANTYRMGLAAPVAPNAKVTDGELDIVILGDLSRGELIPYYRAMRQQLHLTLPKAKELRGKVVRIDSRRRMPVHCDDRIIGTTPVTIEAKPKALKVLVEKL